MVCCPLPLIITVSFALFPVSFLLKLKFVSHFLHLSFVVSIAVLKFLLRHYKQEGLWREIEDHIENLLFIDSCQLQRNVLLELEEIIDVLWQIEVLFEDDEEVNLSREVSLLLVLL